jgi:hypothetical protein
MWADFVGWSLKKGVRQHKRTGSTHETHPAPSARPTAPPACARHTWIREPHRDVNGERTHSFGHMSCVHRFRVKHSVSAVSTLALRHRWNFV